jgi:uncharacterized protein YdaU (DUF1376 family)
VAKADTYMPVVIGDYLKDTMRLTTEQHGAFFLILLDYWTKGAPPDDDETLASIARLPLDRWQKARPVLAGFFKVEGGRWINKRAEEELAAARAKSQKATESANKRWDGSSKSEPDANGHANASPEHMLETCSAPAPSPISKKDKITDSGFEEFWGAYPLKKSRGQAERAYQSARKATDAATLLAGAKRYAADPSRKPEFTKHAATWLNGKCWLDETAPQSTLGESGSASVGPVDAEASLWRSRTDGFVKRKFWTPNYGDPPGHPRCKVPAAILREFGFGIGQKGEVA